MTRAWPKVEAIVVTHLESYGHNASAKVPDPIPSLFVQVILTGNRQRSLTVRDSLVTLDCWAQTESEASDLADAVYSDLSNMSNDAAYLPEGEDGWAGGPYSMPDPISGRARYQMTAVVRNGVGIA